LRYFITYEELRGIGEKIDKYSLLEKSKHIIGKNIFLSHSSKDHDLIPGVIQILEGHGGRVYIDENDPALEVSDFTQTAARLREVINRCGKFVLFVTPKTKDSMWIPWELGLGDGINKEINVVLFPSAEKEYEQSWSEQEYLGLYQRIIWGNFAEHDPEWLVLNHKKNEAVRLRNWITN